MVGNGQHLECRCICANVTMVVQSFPFTTNLYVLPITGANVVLGVQWLKSLGPVLTDYNTLSMQFIHEGRLVKLKGDDDANIQMISPPQLRRICRRQGDGTCFHIAVLIEEIGPMPNLVIPPEFQPLLTKFCGHVPNSPDLTSGHNN